MLGWGERFFVLFSFLGFFCLFVFFCFVFQKQAFEHHSPNANENNSHVEMPLVINLKKMGTMVRWLHVTNNPFIPTKDGGEEKRESWKFVPATTQDPTQLGGACYLIVLEYQWMSNAGGLHMSEQGARFEGTMLGVAGTTCRRSCSALWTSWRGNVGENCKEMLS